MENTKEKILLTALRLFSKYGYCAVSVSDIAGELGITKGALYRHYKSKRDIFDSIVMRMVQLDYSRSVEYNMPESEFSKMEDKYKEITLNDIATFTLAQFSYWTEEEFPSLFRKMLTIEQYTNEEASKLYHQYLLSGPLGYMEDIFREITGDKENAISYALEFYSPVFTLYGMYDWEENKEKISKMLKKHIDNFMKNFKNLMKEKGEKNGI